MQVEISEKIQEALGAMRAQEYRAALRCVELYAEQLVDDLVQNGGDPTIILNDFVTLVDIERDLVARDWGLDKMFSQRIAGILSATEVAMQEQIVGDFSELILGARADHLSVESRRRLDGFMNAGQEQLQFCRALPLMPQAELDEGRVVGPANLQQWGR